MTFASFLRLFGPLKHLPPLPWLADGLLQLHTVVFRREVAAAIDAVEREVCSWPGVRIRLHKYGGLQFDLGRTELGHIHGNGLVDFIYHRRGKAALIRQGLTQDHHTFPNSGWISYWIRAEADATPVIAIFREVYVWRQQKGAGDKAAKG